MHDKTRSLVSLLGGLMLLAGCASTGAPDNWLPVAADAMRDPYGGWITVDLQSANYPRSVAGEFLCLGTDSLYVLVPYAVAGNFVRSYPLSAVHKARVAHFDPRTGSAAGWVAAGSVSTLSHGVGAAFTLPLWLIGGSAMAGSHSRTPLVDYPRHPWAELRMYARFPQGPPPGLYRLGLLPKTGHFQVPDDPGVPARQDTEFDDLN